MGSAVNISNFRTNSIDVELSLDTSAYTAGDVLADFQVFYPAGDKAQKIRGTINDVKVVDKDDQGLEMDIVFAQIDDETDTITLGTENSAVSISDADAQKILGIVNVSSYTDLVGSQFGSPNSFTPIAFNYTQGSGIYVGAITRGAPTHTANGVVLKLNISTE